MPFKDPEKRRQMSRIYTQRWRERNPDKVREGFRKWRENNLEYDRVRCLEYLAANRTEINVKKKEAARAYRKANPGMDRELYKRDPERFKAKVAKRRALKLAAGNADIDALAVLERDDGACGICGKDVDPFNFQVDHVIPLTRGGRHAYDNVQATHPACNIRKQNKLPEELAA